MCYLSCKVKLRKQDEHFSMKRMSRKHKMLRGIKNEAKQGAKSDKKLVHTQVKNMWSVQKIALITMRHNRSWDHEMYKKNGIKAERTTQREDSSVFTTIYLASACSGSGWHREIPINSEEKTVRKEIRRAIDMKISTT